MLNSAMRITIPLAFALASSVANAQPAEDCLPLNPNNLSIFTDSGKFILSDDGGSRRLFAFDILSEAQRTKQIIEFYGMNETCFVGRANPDFNYLLVNGASPQGALAGEDCVFTGVPEVAFVAGSWKIVDGNRWLLDFGSDEAEARDSFELIRFYAFTEYCFVGRPDASFEYWRTDADSDGDGLLDSWEQFGIDVDRNGTIDVPLPTYGADPNHKDLFLEFDWTRAALRPDQSAIRALKTAFRAAPLDVGGIANPDGRSGVRVWVDTGNATDPNGIEGGFSCDDGVDNDGDGQADELDVDCISGFGIEGVGGCADGIDNDNDGQADALDADCMAGGRIEGAGTCSDGIDNDSDGQLDTADSDCLVGDDFGNVGLAAASSVPAASIPNLDASFYAFKTAEFDRDRSIAFRYAVAADGFDPSASEGGGAAGASCRDGIDNDGNGRADYWGAAGLPGDPACPTYGGGWGEVGGNDFIEYNHDPGTIMHELGHNLALGHGGRDPLDGSKDPDNCKPNYVSAMNYDHQFRIFRNPGSTQGQDLDGDFLVDNFIIDFSPPRFAGGRGAAPLSTLDESMLSESLILDATDPVNQFAFVDGGGNKRRWALSGQDLDGDGTPDGIDYDGNGNLTAGNVSVDIDVADATSGRPGACASNNSLTSLSGRNDWLNLELNLRVFGDSANGAINPEVEEERDIFELLATVEELTTADLEISLLGMPNAAVGDTYVLEVFIENDGPQQADGILFDLDVPPGIMFADADVTCLPNGSSLECVAGELAADETKSVFLDFVVGPNDTGMARTFFAEVDHDGPDPVSTNDTAQLTLASNPGFFGFEDPAAPWTSTSLATAPSSDRTQGQQSLSVDGCGYATLVSPEFSTTEVEWLGDAFALDIKVPSQQQNPWWNGDIQGSISIPAAGIHNAYLGYVGLTGLPKDSWETITFSVPQPVRDALAGDHPRAQITFAINSAACAAPVLLDNLRMTGNEMVRTTFGPLAPSPVSTSGLLSFENLADWQSNTATLGAETTIVLEGSQALAVDASGYNLISSRPFSTNELPPIGNTLVAHIWLADPQPNPYWVGDVQVFLTCAGANVYNRYLGRQSLTDLFFEEYQALAYPLPMDIEQLLATPGQTCELDLAVNVGAASGNVLFLDALGFSN